MQPLDNAPTPDPMPHPSPWAGRRALHLAFILSLAAHALVLFLPNQAPERHDPPGRPLQARLATHAEAPEAKPITPTPPAESSTPTPKRKLLALTKPGASTRTPHWSPAEKEEMDRFLRELDQQAKTRPSLAQRSLAMAREMGRQTPQPQGNERDIVEARPNAPPVDRFSLDFYLDGLVKKLNRSASFVKNDPRSRGKRKAAVLIRIHPDGSLKTFQVLNAGDQQDEIAFIKAVVEQAVPFSAFPADLRQSAKSLGLVICVLPPGLGGGGIGFTRTENGRDC